MRRFTQILALVVFLGALALWALKGADMGWTKTTENRMELDPVTEIEYPVIEDRFVPGVDFLAGAFLCAAVLFGVSFVFGRKQNASHNKT